MSKVMRLRAYAPLRIEPSCSWLRGHSPWTSAARGAGLSANPSEHVRKRYALDFQVAEAARQSVAGMVGFAVHCEESLWIELDLDRSFERRKATRQPRSPARRHSTAHDNFTIYKSSGSGLRNRSPPESQKNYRLWPINCFLRGVDSMRFQGFLPSGMNRITAVETSDPCAVMSMLIGEPSEIGSTAFGLPLWLS